MNHDKGLRAKADRAPKKVSRGETATPSRTARSATTTTLTTNRGDASNKIGPRSVKRGHY